MRSSVTSQKIAERRATSDWAKSEWWQRGWDRRGGGDLKRRLWRLEGSRCQRMAIAVRIAPLVLDAGSGSSGQVQIHQRLGRTGILQLRIARRRWRRGGRWRRRIGPAFTNLVEKIKPLRFGVHQRPVRVLRSCTLVPPWWDEPPVAGQLGESPSAARNPNWWWCNDGDRHKITTQTCLSNSQEFFRPRYPEFLSLKINGEKIDTEKRERSWGLHSWRWTSNYWKHFASLFSPCPLHPPETTHRSTSQSWECRGWVKTFTSWSLPRNGVAPTTPTGNHPPWQLPIVEMKNFHLSWLPLKNKKEQLLEIRNVRLAWIVCDNSDA